MQTKQNRNTETPALDTVELVTIDGGVYDGGIAGGGCIPNPLDKLNPQLPTFPTEQSY